MTGVTAKPYRTRADRRLVPAPAAGVGDNLDRIAVGVRLPGGVVHRVGRSGTPRCPVQNRFGQAWIRTTAPVTCSEPECTADG